MKKQPEPYILRIRDSIKRIDQYLDGKSESDFYQDQVLQDALILHLENIGEQCTKLESQFKDSHSDIPWRQIIAARNKLVHDYWNLDMKKIWTILQTDLQTLKQSLSTIWENIDESKYI